MYKLITLILIAIIFCAFRYILVPYAVNNNVDFNDFKEKSLPQSPNYYLLCPKDTCPSASNHGNSPVYSMTVDALKQQWNSMISKQPRTKLLATKENDNQRLYVQYSAFWHFPDLIQIKFIPLDNEQSTFVILSHSIFGHSDFGVNKSRLMLWQKELELIKLLDRSKSCWHT